MFMRTLFRASLKYNSDEDGCSLKLALLKRKKKKTKQLSAQTPIHSSLSREGNGGQSHGPRSLVGCSPLGCTESDTTEVT